MFDDLVESVAVKKKTNTGWALAISIAVQSVCLVVLLLIPLIFTQALPKAMLSTLLVAPPPPGAAPGPAPKAAPPKATRPEPVARLVNQGKLMAPRAIPKDVAVFKEAELPPEAPIGGGGGVPGGIGGGIGGGGGDVFGGSGAGPAPPPPPPPPPVKTPSRIVQGGQVQEALALVHTKPIYPVLARQARISGQVVLHAIIGKDGTVSQLEVESGPPLLVQSALEAVKQWRYQPTLLNGVPVEVDTTITVNFVLGG